MKTLHFNSVLKCMLFCLLLYACNTGEQNESMMRTLIAGEILLTNSQAQIETLTTPELKLSLTPVVSPTSANTPSPTGNINPETHPEEKPQETYILEMINGSSENRIAALGTAVPEMNASISADTILWLEPVAEWDIGSEIKKISFSNDGSLFAAGDMEGKVYVWNFRSGLLMFTAEYPINTPVSDLVFEPSGCGLWVSFQEEKNITYLDLNLREFQINYNVSLPQPVIDLVISADDYYLAAVYHSIYNSPLIFKDDDTKGFVIWNFSGESDNLGFQLEEEILKGAFSKDSEYFYAITKYSLNIFDGRSGKKINSIKTENPISDFIFHQNDQSFYLLMEDGSIQNWLEDLSQSTNILIPPEHDQPDSISSMLYTNPFDFNFNFNANKRFMPDSISLSYKNQLLATKGEVYLIENQTSPDYYDDDNASNWSYSNYGDYTMFSPIYVWDLNTNELLGTLSCEEEIIESIAFSPDSNLIAACTNQGKIHFWGIP